MNTKNKLLLGTLLCASLSVSLASYAADTKSKALTLDDLTYTYEEMLSFDVQQYISQNAPHLNEHAEAISHYAGLSGTSPRVLIALIELETGLITNKKGDVNLPFGVLSSKFGFIEQLKEISDQVLLHRHQRSSAKNAFIDKKSLKLKKTLQKLFPDFEFSTPSKTSSQSRSSAKKAAASVSASSSLPAWNYFSLPYPVGETWYIGGAHANDGGTGVHSSLDLSTGGFGWGADLSNIWVTAAAPGTVKVHSSCFMEIIHDGGWSTTYYHMSDLQFATGASINRDAAIGHYASNYNQAVCNGGSSTGPHLHFSLKKNGYQHSLNNVYLSGYKIKATSNTSYDTNCNLFNLSQWNGTWCAGNFFNPGVDVYSGLTVNPLNGTANTKLYYKMVISDAPSDANRIRFQTWGGTGDADLYVKKGGVPTLTDYDCRPFENGNREICDTSSGLSSSISGTWYAMINGASTFQNLSLGVNHSGWYDISSINQQSGTWNRSYINVPDGISKLEVIVSGGTGDPDLYLNFGTEPTGTNWQCRPYKDAGYAEICTINNPSEGTWHIGIYSYTALSNVSMKARWHP